MSSLVREFVEQGYVGRIQQFDPEVCSVETAASVMDSWRELGAFTVFMAGTFDIPTPNHRLGLGEARLMAGALACGIDYPGLYEDGSEHLIRTVRDTAASHAVKLMVTLDTDEGAKNLKAFKTEKGESPKPILSWKTRAYNLASYTIPHSSGMAHTMVDYITNHGPKGCEFCEDCLSVDNALMISRLQPDLVVINAASTDTIKTVSEEVQLGRLPKTVIGFNNEYDHHMTDDLIGGRISGTAIIRRARGLTSDT